MVNYRAQRKQYKKTRAITDRFKTRVKVCSISILMIRISFLKWNCYSAHRIQQCRSKSRVLEIIQVCSLQPSAAYARIEVEMSSDIGSNQNPSTVSYLNQPLSSSPARLNSGLPFASSTSESLDILHLYSPSPPPPPVLGE